MLIHFSHGAEAVDPSQSSSQATHQHTFLGRAYRLGDTAGQSDVVEAAALAPDRPQVISTIIPWKADDKR